jgi:leucyl-tRNA synthetase
LYDIGVVPTKEPYQKRTSHGLILAEGGEKMSKSKGNTVSPDELVALYGADTLRVYEMFMGPFDQAIAWNTSNMIGSRRFIERVYNLEENVVTKKKAPTDGSRKHLELIINQTIKKVGDDIESMGFNTAVSSLMILLNALEKEETVYRNEYEVLLQLLAPIAPHVTEEIWAELGNKKSIHTMPWQEFDPKKLQSDTWKIVVQINGKVRETFVSHTDDEEEVKSMVLLMDKIKARIGDKTPARVIYVKGKLVNIVVPGL